MWSFMGSPSSAMGNSSPLWGHSLAQKRNFHLNFASISIAPGKSFHNPNFVNKRNPNIHNYQNNFSSAFQRLCQVDNSQDSNLKAELNSSKSIEENLNIPLGQFNSKHSETPFDMCYSKKSSRKNRKNRRRKMQNRYTKHSKSQRKIYEMIEASREYENSSDNSNTPSNCSSIPKMLHLGDFIVESSNDSQNTLGSNCDNDLDTEVSVCSSSPLNTNVCFVNFSPRKRQNSTTESEDSFIVFDSKTDDELDFSSEQSEDECELNEEYDSVDESENENDLDSSSSAVPTKRVRFADDSELCEIHPMIQWAFAYQQARKGPWEMYARDRGRFKRRVDETEPILTPILDCKHRDKIFKERFQNLDVC